MPVSHHIVSISTALCLCEGVTIQVQTFCSNAGRENWSNLKNLPGGVTETITLTILPDQELVKTVQDVGAMPFTEFVTLYSVSVK